MFLTGAHYIIIFHIYGSKGILLIFLYFPLAPIIFPKIRWSVPKTQANNSVLVVYDVPPPSPSENLKPFQKIRNPPLRFFKNLMENHANSIKPPGSRHNSPIQNAPNCINDRYVFRFEIPFPTHLIKSNERLLKQSTKSHCDFMYFLLQIGLFFLQRSFTYAQLLINNKL